MRKLSFDLLRVLAHPITKHKMAHGKINAQHPYNLVPTVELITSVLPQQVGITCGISI